MTPRIIPVELFDLVVFGATGDLSQRKLLPALFHRDLQGQIPPGSRIIGCSRRALSNEDFRAFARKAIEDHVAAADRPPGMMARFLERVSYVTADAAQNAGWAELDKVLNPEPHRIRVFYLAVGPDLFGPICEKLDAYRLVTPRTRVVIEKPLGKSGESAHALNESIGRVFREPQVYRIDHYLGKETVQNLMALRFANALFEPVWNSGHVDHVQITVAETLGVEGRAGYYDTAGALRDMVQNHMLQLLCLVAMEPPTSTQADALRDEKLKVLKSLKPITAEAVPNATVRGQYRAGAANGGAVKGYLEELGSAASKTETFVALKAEINNWRWAGVPFYLRTGKRLPSRVSEIVVTFKPIPYSVFDGQAGPIAPNRLVIRLQPGEGVKLWLMIKDPGPGGMRLSNVPLDMSFADAFNVRNPDAYERLIMDVVRGNQALFMRRDEVEAAWGWIDPVLDAWAASPELPKPYTAGTWGPSSAVALIERDGRTWYEDQDID
ncbi:glucose-6-phosphate dehydrogenase [Aestuariivirga sp.]|uniref:glucose-6-phosphate dehydrogenase n=1 Tax=Aestuariivirga sp. TaxID=2650926 RepID=UPI0025B8E87A|nr:glucose-6-phosphate dehydrogenase [Aestuariivirga sp.]MCA3554730.1 glucose-6-phosphate dehydrogenase [Aestuariivirga sp.]